jgi:hypothetical protein
VAEPTPDGTDHDWDPPVSENVHVTVPPVSAQLDGNAAAEPATTSANIAEKPDATTKTRLRNEDISPHPLH